MINYAFKTLNKFKLKKKLIIFQLVEPRFKKTIYMNNLFFLKKALVALLVRVLLST